LLCKNGFWVDVDLVHRVIEQEGLGNQINPALLFWGTLALVVALCSSLLIFWPRIVAIPLFRRSTLCLISAFIALVIVAQSPMAAGMPRVLLWSFQLEPDALLAAPRCVSSVLGIIADAVRKRAFLPRKI
jgi:hypothetical protein